MRIFDTAHGADQGELQLNLVIQGYSAQLIAQFQKSVINRSGRLSPEFAGIMKPIKSDIVEEICPACSGTGFLPVIKQPAPGKRIYGPRCTKCGGKGKLHAPAN